MYEDPIFKKAIVQSIKSYFKGEGFEEYSKTNKKFKYTKKYFDRFEKEQFGSTEKGEK